MHAPRKASSRYRLTPVAVAITLLVSAAAGARADDLLLFSPDWNSGNLGVLSAAVREHLSEAGPSIGFKAFARYEDFRAELDAGRPAFLSAPAWIESERTGRTLRPLARPLLAGTASYRKVLLVGPDVSAPRDLVGRSIAVASHGGGRELLGPVLDGLRLAEDEVRVIPVPKDVDALLALGFGQVDAALVTAGQLARLAAVNPTAASALNRIATTAEIPYPLLYASDLATEALTHEMIRSVEQLTETRSGKNALGLLGYDRYEIITTARAAGGVGEERR